MKLKRAVNIGKECGLKNIRECIANVEIHSSVFFTLNNTDKGLQKLYEDLEILSEKYEITSKEAMEWTIKEYELYEKS